MKTTATRPMRHFIGIVMAMAAGAGIAFYEFYKPIEQAPANTRATLEEFAHVSLNLDYLVEKARAFPDQLTKADFVTAVSVTVRECAMFDGTDVGIPVEIQQECSHAFAHERDLCSKKENRKSLSWMCSRQAF